MGRLTDKDHTFGPFTIGRVRGSSWRLTWSSGNREEGPAHNKIYFSTPWFAIRIYMPNIVKPWSVRHTAGWDEATVARMGRNWYDETFSREYGFSLHDGFLILRFGAQTGDSSTEKDWCCHLPWRNWRHVRHSLYGLNGEHFWTDPNDKRNVFTALFNARKECPSVVFDFADFDGEKIKATTMIEEMEWHLGSGWFKWLSLFRRPKISRDLKLDFSSEVGSRKGSWKGGTVGHSIEMLPGELHEAAFRRYCEKQKMTFIGAAE